MELDIRKLNAQKKYEGEFEYDYTPTENLCLLPLCELSDIKVVGSYVIYESGEVGVNLTVSYKLKGQCSYCLKDAQKEISFQTEATFLTERDDDNYQYDGIKINLDPAVKDAILISQPGVLLCREDCAGIDCSKT